MEKSTVTSVLFYTVISLKTLHLQVDAMMDMLPEMASVTLPKLAAFFPCFVLALAHGTAHS